jgi:hypothetical protein
MRLRLIAFFPPAVLIAALLLVTASSFVSAVERSLIEESNLTPAPIRVQRHETECDALRRELETLFQTATSCDRDTACLRSPLLCPITMNPAAERRYRELRLTLADRCDVPRGEVGNVSGRVSRDVWEVAAAEASSCAASHVWPESAVGEGVGPRSYLF